MSDEPEALRLAHEARYWIGERTERGDHINKAAAELRRQHEAIKALEAERDALQAFAVDVMEAWPSGGIDGGELESIACKHGLLTPELKTEPCGECCTCNSDYGISPDEWAAGIVCYRKTVLLRGRNARLPEV